MSWQRRLAELVAAGGLIAGAGCGGGPVTGTCNANPDPCCSSPDGPVCAAQQACLAEPTATCCQGYLGLDNCIAPSCDPLADNDFDGPGPLTKTGTACGANPAIGCYGAFGTGINGNVTPTRFQCDVPDPATATLRHGDPLPPTAGSAVACAPGYMLGRIDDTGAVQLRCLALCAPGEAYAGNPGAQHPNGLAPHRCSTQDAVGAFGVAATETENGEHCMYSWTFELDANGVLHRSATSDTVGVCVDHTKRLYASTAGGSPDTPWPPCASAPLHAAPGSRVPDAIAMGCVRSTTAGK